MSSLYFQKRQAIAQGLAEPDPKKSAKKAISSDGGELKLWFRTIESQQPSPCKCAERGKIIPLQFIFHAIAHIFPKASFESVMTDDNNYLILGASCCHDKSHKIETFKKMKVWRQAVEKFLLFRHLLTHEEKAKKHYTLFLNAAKESFPELF